MVAGLERPLGLASRLLRLLEVDLAGQVRRLGHDDDLVGPDLEEPADDRERLLGAALADPQLADAEHRHQRRMVRQDAELALGARARWTESTSSEYASRSGVTISSWSGTASPAFAELLGVGTDVLDRAGEEEGLLGQGVGLALEDLLERRDRVLDRDVGARIGR